MSGEVGAGNEGKRREGRGRGRERVEIVDIGVCPLLSPLLPVSIRFCPMIDSSVALLYPHLYLFDARTVFHYCISISRPLADSIGIPDRNHM